jgi:hypothetical protein
LRQAPRDSADGIGRRAWRPLALALLAALLLGSTYASAERTQYGSFIVSLKGGIAPKKLPRGHPAPVAVYLAGGVDTADRAPLPRVDSIKLELAWRGELNTRGLAVCPRARLDSTNSEKAIENCRQALVGHGHLNAKIFIPGQVPFGIRAHLLAFNSKSAEGEPVVLVHGFAGTPPVSFVLPFTVTRQPGTFKTVLTSVIGKAVGPWPRVSNFRIAVNRHFRHEGKRQSYLNASCPVPEGFTAGFLSLARATYTLADGEELTTESVRSCRAR